MLLPNALFVEILGERRDNIKTSAKSHQRQVQSQITEAFESIFVNGFPFFFKLAINANEFPKGAAMHLLSFFRKESFTVALNARL